LFVACLNYLNNWLKIKSKYLLEMRKNWTVVRIEIESFV
jgi:hypothetical protein